jgi:hypothetical protein
MLIICDGKQTHSEICYDADNERNCPLCVCREYVSRLERDLSRAQEEAKEIKRD